MKSHFRVAGVLTLMIASTLSGQSSEARDLAKYRTRGPIHLTLADPERTRKESDLRAFLWENWRDRRRAHVIESNANKEGERSVVEFFIEPDSRGDWKLVVKIEREVFTRARANPKRPREKLGYTCTSLERVETPTDLLQPLISIPAESSRLPSTYRLHPVCGSDGNLPMLW